MPAKYCSARAVYSTYNRPPRNACGSQRAAFALARGRTVPHSLLRMNLSAKTCIT